MNREVPARWFVLSAAGVHLGLGILAWIGGPRLLWGDEKSYIASALAVLQGDPSWWPVPLWPPLYPWFLAGILGVSAGNPGGIAVVQTGLLFIAAAVFGDLVRRWSGSRLAGLSSFLMMAAFPSLAVYGRFVWPEVLHLTLVMIALWVLAVRRESLGWLTVAGLSLGLALLTKSLLGPFLPFLLGAAFVGDRTPRRLLRLGVCLATVLAVIAPVIAMQYQRIGAPVIADSSAFNLWVGLNDRGTKSFEDPIVARAYRDYMSWEGTFTQRNARMRRQSMELIDQTGVASVVLAQVRRQYFRLFDKDCYLTEQLPGGAATLGGSGFTSLGPRSSIVVKSFVYGSYALLLLTAPLGFLVWSFADKRWPRTLLLFLLYNLALFLLLHVKSRYRIQLLPVFFLGSSAAVAWFRSILCGNVFWKDSVGKIALAGLFSAVLLYLAF